MSPRRVALLLTSIALAVTACGSSSSGPAPVRKHAAEPAVAPVPTATPAGTSRAVGANPQGIVYDPVSQLLAVAVQDPDRLLLLDPTTLAVRRSVALPGSVRHLQLGHGGGSVLVPVEPAARILQVALPSGRIVTDTGVQKQPHDAAQASNGELAVGNEYGRSLSVVRAGRVVHTFDDLTQPGGVIADGTTVGVVDVGAYTLSTYDLTTLRRTGRVAAGKGPTHGVLLSGDRMLVVDTRGDAILVFDARTLKQTGRLALPGSPYGVSVDPTTGLVWVTLTARDEVVGLATGADDPRVLARLPTVQQPDTVAVEPGSRTVWVTGTDTGVVERIPTGVTTRVRISG